MQFFVLSRNERINRLQDSFYLTYDNWDDYGYKTLFDAVYVDAHGETHRIGPIKIGYAGMECGRTFDQIPRNFSSLPNIYFSLGQEDKYYSNIASLGDEKRKEILSALQDLAFDLSIFEQYEDEDVLGTSLMRSISSFSVQSQLHRIANGGARLTEYNFSYSFPENEGFKNDSTVDMSFSVRPESNPPTNIHVIIGRNGTGKTRLIKNMICCIQSNDVTFGNFSYCGDTYSSAEFANILCVAFSPFDDFSILDEVGTRIPYTFIGLNKNSSNNLLQTIEDQFVESLRGCVANSRKKTLWLNAIQELTSDPVFDSIHIETLIDNLSNATKNGDDSSAQDQISKVFSQLSSGHKVVLSIVTCCVDKLEEKSIVFLDEPENHLHPPLLSALIRTLSNLLVNRNGVAIISTHSPVVLQEVPRSCVWALRRVGDTVIPERLQTKTFGSSISQLTNEVFGLEVTNSGFHKLLTEAVDSNSDRIYGSSEYDSIVTKFNNQLGDEAKLHLRTLLAVKAAAEE